MIKERTFSGIREKHGDPDKKVELRRPVSGAMFPGELIEEVDGFKRAVARATKVAQEAGEDVVLWDWYVASRMLRGEHVRPLHPDLADHPHMLTIRHDRRIDEGHAHCIRWDAELEALSERVVKTASVSYGVQLTAAMVEDAGYPKIASVLAELSQVLAEEVPVRDAEYDTAAARREAELEERRRTRKRAKSSRRPAAAPVAASAAAA